MAKSNKKYKKLNSHSVEKMKKLSTSQSKNKETTNGPKIDENDANRIKVNKQKKNTLSQMNIRVNFYCLQSLI